ncbi:hypothetical protein DPMN_146527 [Dreissena polymorpha]|uniref:Uncharacterized protein n=1 Tax=Dreissena polymorpha TaxID=45954 RepID=A0A9D4IZT1_DREPO|nr:hypothetical protein DPMN_146527 [Dreissena polymorpha]
MELMKLTLDKKGETIPVHGGARPKIPKVQKSMTVATSETIIAKNQAPMVEKLSPEHDGFFDLLSKFQGRRIDEQRCSLELPGEKNGLLESENKENKPKLVSTPDSENFGHGGRHSRVTHERPASLTTAVSRSQLSGSY